MTADLITAGFCEDCGARLDAGDAYCGECGAALGSPTPGPVPSHPPAPVRQTHAAVTATSPATSVRIAAPQVRPRPSATPRQAPSDHEKPGPLLLGILGVGVLIGSLWRLAAVLLTVGAIAGYIWGGSTEAHVRCVAHELGAPGLLNSVACAVAH